jgi:hypothetical protein
MSVVIAITSDKHFELVDIGQRGVGGRQKGGSLKY